MNAFRRWAIALVGLCAVGCAETVHKLNARGIDLYEQGKYLRARAYFNQALVLASDDAALLFNMGSTLHKLGRTTEAENHYRRCLIIDPSHAKAHRGMAVLLAERDQRDQAVQHLRAFRDRYPDRADPYVELAWFHYRSGDLPAARDLLGQAVARQADHAEAVGLLGDVYRDLDMRPEAILAYREALRLEPNQPGLRERLSALEKTAGGASEPVAAREG